MFKTTTFHGNTAVMPLLVFGRTHWYVVVPLLLLGSVMVAIVARLWVRSARRKIAYRIRQRVSDQTQYARDQHDSFLQEIHGLLLRFRTATNQIEAGPTKDLLEETLSQSEDVMRDGELIHTSLRCSNRDQIQDLQQDVLQMARQFQLRGEEGLLTEVRGLPQLLRDEVRKESLLICREAISNVLRHADGASPLVIIVFTDQAFELSITDSGTGLPVEILAGRRLPGLWGIAGMQERALTIGGRLYLEANKPHGTIVRLRVPARYAYVRGWRWPLARLFKQR